MSGEQLALVVLGAFLGLFESGRIIDVIKERLGWEDMRAKFLAAAVSFVLAAGALFVTGELKLVDFTFNNLPAVFAPLYALSEIVYYYKRSKSE